MTGSSLDRFSSHKPTSPWRLFYEQGGLSPSGAEGKREREIGERARKEAKMKRGERAEGNEKNFTAQFLLLSDPIIRFCI